MARVKNREQSNLTGRCTSKQREKKKNWKGQGVVTNWQTMTLTDFNTQWRADNRILEIEGNHNGQERNRQAVKSKTNTQEKYYIISNKPKTLTRVRLNKISVTKSISIKQKDIVLSYVKLCGIVLKNNPTQRSLKFIHFTFRIYSEPNKMYH